MIRYLNLTSGLEEGHVHPLVRIQSSQLETGALWKVIADLDYQFLIDAAMVGVIFVDGGSRRGPVSRAQWQGIPWIKFAYAKANSLPDWTTPEFLDHFERSYKRSHPFRKQALNKLRYVYKLTQRPLEITTESFQSTMDGDYEKLSAILRSMYGITDHWAERQAAAKSLADDARSLDAPNPTPAT